MTENNQENRPSVFDNPAVIEPKSILFNEEALITAYQVTIGDFSTCFDSEDVFEPNGNGNDFRIRITKFGSKTPSGGAREGGRIGFSPQDAVAARRMIEKYFRTEAWDKELKDHKGKLIEIMFSEGWIYIKLSDPI